MYQGVVDALLGRPYVWGGGAHNPPQIYGTFGSGNRSAVPGYDCSGLAQAVLWYLGRYGDERDRTADGLMSMYPVDKSRSGVQLYDLVGFGSPAYHVGVVVGAQSDTSLTILEAGGGRRDLYGDDPTALVRFREVSSWSSIARFPYQVWGCSGVGVHHDEYALTLEYFDALVQFGVGGVSCPVELKAYDDALVSLGYSANISVS